MKRLALLYLFSLAVVYATRALHLPTWTPFAVAVAAGVVLGVLTPVDAGADK